jgi:hypothetical protein
VKLALALGNTINARTTFGDYKMIGTPRARCCAIQTTFRNWSIGHGRPALSPR